MQDCKCDCVGKPPTYPVFRSTEHLPSCPWYMVEMQERTILRLQEAVARLATSIDMGDEDTESMEQEVESILYLGRPTPAPEPPLVGVKEEYGPGVTYKGVKPDFLHADNEYAIWKAIGRLTQRVRDLEHPTPASEPPKAMIGVSNGKDTIWHDPEVKAEVESEVKAATLRAVGEAIVRRSCPGSMVSEHLTDSICAAFSNLEIEALRAGHMPEGWGK